MANSINPIGSFACNAQIGGKPTEATVSVGTDGVELDFKPDGRMTRPYLRNLDNVPVDAEGKVHDPARVEYAEIHTKNAPLEAVDRDGGADVLAKCAAQAPWNLKEEMSRYAEAAASKPGDFKPLAPQPDRSNTHMIGVGLAAAWAFAKTKTQ